MFFCHAFNQSMVEGVSGIKVVDKFLIIFHRMLVLAFAHSQFWERSTIAQHQLGSEFINEVGVRLAATLHTMRFVDDEHGFCVGYCVYRSVKSAKHLVVVFACQQFAVCQQLCVEQQYIYLVLCVMGAVEEMSYSRRHILTSFLFLLLRFEQTQLYLCAIAAHSAEVAFHFRFFQESRRSSFDRQCGYGYDELVEAAALVQFEHRSGVDVSLSGARLHLYVEQAMVRQALYLLCEHIACHPLLCGFLQNACLLAHSLQSHAA